MEWAGARWTLMIYAAPTALDWSLVASAATVEK